VRRGVIHKGTVWLISLSLRAILGLNEFDNNCTFPGQRVYMNHQARNSVAACREIAVNYFIDCLIIYFTDSERFVCGQEFLILASLLSVFTRALGCFKRNVSWEGKRPKDSCSAAGLGNDYWIDS
jgi:hypothetical protein